MKQIENSVSKENQFAEHLVLYVSFKQDLQSKKIQEKIILKKYSYIYKKSERRSLWKRF